MLEMTRENNEEVANGLFFPSQDPNRNIHTMYAAAVADMNVSTSE